MVEKSTEQVSWNLSQMLIMEIGEHLKTASTKYIQHDFSSCFMNLKSIKSRIVPYLDSDELLSLNKLETPIMNCFGITKLRGFSKPSKEQKKLYHFLWKKLDEYNNELLSLLRKYGMLIPMKEDRTKMSA